MDETPAAAASWAELLAEVAEARRKLDMIEHLAVKVVREAGATWEDIGEALGVSRQAARERFGEPRKRR